MAYDNPDKPKGKKVVFDAPEGFTPPEHDGDTFKIVCELRPEEGNKLCLVSLGDHEMPGYEHDEGEETVREAQKKPTYRDMGTSIVNAMAGEQT